MTALLAAARLCGVGDATREKAPQRVFLTAAASAIRTRAFTWHPALLAQLKSYFSVSLRGPSEVIVREGDAWTGGGIQNGLRDDSFADGVERQFRNAFQIQLLHDVGAVRLDRVDAEMQKVSDLLVRFSFRH